MRGKYKTDIELIMESALLKANIDNSYDYSIRSKYGYRIDFALPQYKLGIECDGEAWHINGNLRDKKRDGYFKSRGWKIIRFWGNDIKNNIQGCMKTITEEIQNEKNQSAS